ncbi:MAG: transcriptional repressor [Candidatus Symbiothrix sp.]|nr:transcriptional repressor [Candidatus Symbiothrix sp.]
MEVKDRLLECGVKPSLQRMAIMNFLVKNPIHPTVDLIFTELYPSIPTLSKTTVYNTLKLLEEQGAIHSLNIDEKNVRYDADISNHAHFKCKKCGQVQDVRLKDTDSIQIANADKWLITECQIYYKGYCEKCRNEMN